MFWFVFPDQWQRNNCIGRFEIDFGSDFNECETPALWFPLADKKGKKVGSAEVQVQIQVRRDIDVIQARNYTHILQFTIKSGSELSNMDWCEKGDPYVRVEIGTQVYKTKVVKNENNPVWNESLYLFVDTDTQKDYRLVLSVLDKDLRKDDRVGTGYLPIREIFDSPNHTFENDVILTGQVVNLDKGLRAVEEAGSQSSIKKDKECGKLQVRAKLIPRRDIEKEFYQHLLTHFDTNKDGKLQKQEVQQLLLYLEISQNVDEFMQKFDENYDDLLTKDEILHILQDAKFQDSNDSSKVCCLLFSFVLRRDFTLLFFFVFFFLLFVLFA